MITAIPLKWNGFDLQCRNQGGESRGLNDRFNGISYWYSILFLFYRASVLDVYFQN